MKIKSIDDLSLEELKEILDNNYYDLYNVQESEIRKRYNILLEQDRLKNPVFITKEEFLRRNPKYNEVIGRGLFGREKRRNSRMLHFYDVEDTEREHRIVRSACNGISVYRFSENNITTYYPVIAPLGAYGCCEGSIKYLGDGSYLIRFYDGKKIIVNVLVPNKPIILVRCKPSEKIQIDNDIIEIIYKNDKVSKMTTRGFKVED